MLLLQIFNSCVLTNCKWLGKADILHSRSKLYMICAAKTKMLPVDSMEYINDMIMDHSLDLYHTNHSCELFFYMVLPSWNLLLSTWNLQCQIPVSAALELSKLLNCPSCEHAVARAVNSKFKQLLFCTVCRSFWLLNPIWRPLTCQMCQKLKSSKNCGLGTGITRIENDIVTQFPPRLPMV